MDIKYRDKVFQKIVIKQYLLLSFIQFRSVNIHITAYT